VLPPALERHRDFAEQVAAARAQDPHPTFERLSAFTGVPVDDLRHYALVKFVAAGSEAILACGPDPLRDLLAAREAQDWERVAGIIDWIAAGR
jgi:hypothetical protein